MSPRLMCPHCGGGLNGLMAALEERAHKELSRKIKAGIASARARGVRFGIEPKISGAARSSMLAMVDAHPELTLEEIARKHGVSRVTLWRYMRSAYEDELRARAQEGKR